MEDANNIPLVVSFSGGKTSGLMAIILNDYGITKKEVEDFWKNQDFTLNLREHEGNCDLCWKKSDKKLVTLIRNNPKSIKWWRDMEKKYSDKEFGKRSKKLEPTFFFRGNKSSDDLIDLANSCELDSLSDEGKDCFCKSD